MSYRKKGVILKTMSRRGTVVERYLEPLIEAGQIAAVIYMSANPARAAGKIAVQLAAKKLIEKLA